MGNYISRAGGKALGEDAAIKAIFPDGEIRRFHEPKNAAELMLEMPNFFLANAASLQIGKRFAPLNADDDLEMGNLYVFFPMKRLTSSVTAADMGRLFLTVKRVSIGTAKVLPECEQDLQIVGSDEDNRTAPKLNLDEIEEYSRPEFRHRMSMCRSKKPMLETIVEEHLSLRFVMMMDS